MKGNRAFTLVEMLAVVVILAILVGLIVPSVSGYIAEGKKEYNISLKKQLLLAGKNYYSSNKEKLPTRVSVDVSNFVTAKELSTSKYLSKDLVDSNKNSCMDDSYVVARNDGTGVKYYSCLICGSKSYYSGDEEKYCKKIERPNMNEISCSIDSNTVKSTDYSVTADVKYTGNIEELYTVDGHKVRHTQELSTDSSSTKVKTISISNYGDNYVYVGANNGKLLCGTITIPKPSDYGVISKDMYLVDKSRCDSVRENGISKADLKSGKYEKYTGDNWTNKCIYVDLKYKALSFKEKSVKYKRDNANEDKSVTIKNKLKYFVIDAINDNEKEHSWVVKGTLNDPPYNESKTDFNTKIDITSPKVTVKNSSNGVWTNKKITVDITAEDELSGVRKIEYSIDNGNTWKSLSSSGDDKKKTAKVAFDNTKNKIFNMLVRAVDNTGNIGTASTPIKLDVTPPSVTISSSNTNWTKNNVTVSSTASDSNSGVESIEYSKNGKTWSTLVNATSGSKTYSSTVNEYMYVRAKDRAGNYSSSKNTLVRIDKLPPNSPYISTISFEKSVISGRHNCSGVGGTQSNASCNVCILFTKYKAYGFSAPRTYSDVGGSGVDYQQNTWNHNGNAPKYTSWGSSAGWSWRANKNHYMNYVWIDFGSRVVDKVGNVGYHTIVHYRIYDTDKRSAYNACVDAYI